MAYTAPLIIASPQQKEKGILSKLGEGIKYLSPIEKAKRRIIKSGAKTKEEAQKAYIKGELKELAIGATTAGVAAAAALNPSLAAGAAKAILPKTAGGALKASLLGLTGAGILSTSKTAREYAKNLLKPTYYIEKGGKIGEIVEKAVGSTEEIKKEGSDWKKALTTMGIIGGGLTAGVLGSQIVAKLKEWWEKRQAKKEAETEQAITPQTEIQPIYIEGGTTGVERQIITEKEIIGAVQKPEQAEISEIKPVGAISGGQPINNTIQIQNVIQNHHKRKIYKRQTIIKNRLK